MARTIASPIRDMPPITSVSPDWYLLGVNPNSGPAPFDFLIRCGSSTAVLYVIATIGPTPGAVINCRQTLSRRTILRSALWSILCSRCSVARQEHRSSDLLQHRVIGDKLAHARLKGSLRHFTELQSEAAQDAAQAQFHIPQLVEQQSAPRQQRSNLLRARRFCMHRLVPAHA